MPLKKPKVPTRRNGRRHDLRDVIVEDADKNEGGDRDLAHGEGGTMEVPGKPDDLNRDD